MSSQYWEAVNTEVVIPTAYQAGDEHLLSSKIANITSLVSSLNAAVEDLGMLELPRLDKEFDYYDEVQRFEIKLIQSALRISGGSQVKAARLLKLKPTTLNAKIKLFQLATK